MDYSIISEDVDVCEYVEKMADWISINTLLSPDEVYIVILGEKDRIKALFEPNPLIILSEDPEKFAELFAVACDLIEEPKLEFVDD